MMDNKTHELLSKNVILTRKLAESFPGHAGRPGERGGSLPRGEGGGSTDDKSSSGEMKPDNRLIVVKKAGAEERGPKLFSNKADATSSMDSLKSKLTEYPYFSAYVSTLGGEARSAVMFTVGLDPKESWPNKILENSRYGHFALDHDGEFRLISGGGKLRKSTVKSVDEVVAKIKKWAATVKD